VAPTVALTHILWLKFKWKKSKTDTFLCGSVSCKENYEVQAPVPAPTLMTALTHIHRHMNRVSSKQTNFFSRFEPKQTETHSVSVVFRFVSRNQQIIFSVCFGLFRCFEPVSKQPKQKDLFRNKPKKLKEPSKTAM
jgi:hypothetical protein